MGVVWRIDRTILSTADTNAVPFENAPLSRDRKGIGQLETRVDGTQYVDFIFGGESRQTQINA